jgi:rhodanese-related sulfurtransferase
VLRVVRRFCLGLGAVALWVVAMTADPTALAHAGHANMKLVLQADYLKAQYDRGRKLTAIDLRSVDDFRRGHLPGARSLPLDELGARFEEVPRADLVVLYCDCPPQDLEKAYRFLQQRQHRNLSILDDGFRAWAERGYPIER